MTDPTSREWIWCIDLKKLAEPFPEDDIEWRVSRSGTGNKGIFCLCLAYITARAIQQRLDEVCEPENWRNEQPRLVDFGAGFAFVGGISIRVKSDPGLGDEWVTKWDVAEPTNIEAAKGGFSGAMKRAGAQWGIGRYLYHLDETFADVSENGGKGWNYAKLKDGQVYYWRPPSLPGWALPKEEQSEVSADDLNALKRAWRDKFAEEGVSNPDLLRGFTRFVESIVGEFPVSDHTCWTREALQKCMTRVNDTQEPGGVSPAVPFEE